MRNEHTLAHCTRSHTRTSRRLSVATTCQPLSRTALSRKTHTVSRSSQDAHRRAIDTRVQRPHGLLREVPVHSRPEQCQILDDTRPAQAQSTTFLHMVNFGALRRSLYDPPTSSLSLRASCPCHAHPAHAPKLLSWKVHCFKKKTPLYWRQSHGAGEGWGRQQRLRRVIPRVV